MIKFALLTWCLLVSSCTTPDAATAPRSINKAIVVAKKLNLPNLECDELGTGSVLFPDTAVCQVANKAGDVRVPTQVIWIKAGIVEPPDLRVVYNIPNSDKPQGVPQGVPRQPEHVP